MRAEDARLLQGRGRFIDNLTIPGMAHLAFVRSPVPSARVRRVDVAPARSRPGVTRAFSGTDLAGHLPLMPVSVVMPGTAVAEHRPLATDRVSTVGEAVAVVIAEDRATAEDAADAVEVEYDPLPAVSDPFAALAPDAPLVHAELGSNLAYALQLGPPPGLAGSEIVVAERLVNQRLAPSPMETRGVVADYRDADDTLTLYLTTQGPHLIRSRLAELLGLPETRVRVSAGDVGGAFGSKYAVYPEDIVAAVLSRLLRRPLKWIESRSESLTATTHGRGVTADVQLGAARDGRVEALYVQWVADAGAHLTLFPSSALLACSMLSGPYPFRRSRSTCAWRTPTRRRSIPTGASTGPRPPTCSSA